MIQTTSCPIELDRQRNASRNTRSQAKDETKANAIADAEDNGVRYSTSQQSQWTMLST